MLVLYGVDNEWCGTSNILRRKKRERAEEGAGRRVSVAECNGERDFKSEID